MICLLTDFDPQDDSFDEWKSFWCYPSCLECQIKVLQRLMSCKSLKEEPRNIYIYIFIIPFVPGLQTSHCLLELKLFMLHYAALNESPALVYLIPIRPPVLLSSFVFPRPRADIELLHPDGGWDPALKMAVRIKPSSNQVAPTASEPGPKTKPKHLLRPIIGKRQ